MVLNMNGDKEKIKEIIKLLVNNKGSFKQSNDETIILVPRSTTLKILKLLDLEISDANLNSIHFTIKYYIKDYPEIFKLYGITYDVGITYNGTRMVFPLVKGK